MELSGMDYKVDVINMFKRLKTKMRICHEKRKL